MYKTLLTLLFAALVNFSLAGTVVVTNTNDSGAGSLRASFSAATTGDTIRFSPSLIAGGSATVILSSDIEFSKSITIIGLYNSLDTLFISGGNTNRIFTIDSTTNVTLDSLVLINGFNIGDGGAIHVSEIDSLFVNNSIIRSNNAGRNGGGVYFHDSTSIRFASISINNTKVLNNSALNNGGGVFMYFAAQSTYFNQAYSSTTIACNKSLIEGNTAQEDGGGIYIYSKNHSELNLSNCKISNNIADSAGGGVYVYSEDVPNLRNSTAKINSKNTTISFNSANLNGGGIFVSAYHTAIINLESNKILFNTSGSYGGGVFCDSRGYQYAAFIDANNSTISNNSAFNGGGVATYNELNQMNMNLEFNKCNIYNNSATNNGGGIFASVRYAPYISIRGKIFYSSLYNNIAGNDGGAFYGLANDIVELEIANSTFTKNSAINGGAVYSRSSGQNSRFTCLNSTLVYNTATNSGGGIYCSSLGTPYTYILSSIVALNGNSNIFNNKTPTLTSLGYNIFSDVTITGSIASDKMGVDSTTLNLGPLLFNGNRTKHMVPLNPSPAIDSGMFSNKLELSNPQNGAALNARDIGAAESGLIIFKDTICNGDYTSVIGNTHSVSGQYFDTLRNSLGADTLIYVYNLLSLKTYDTLSSVICSGSVILPSGTSYSLTGTHYDTTINHFGCDSITVLYLQNTTDYTISFVQDSLKSNQDNATYQWLDCNNGNTIIAGATNQRYNPTATGNYAVEVTINGCMDTSACFFVSRNCFAKYFPTQPTSGQVVLLDSTMGNNLKYTWYFGDGDSSVSYLPTHNYTNSGTYQVCLKILDTVGFCTDYFCDSITVDSNGILRNGFTLTVLRTIVGVKEMSSLGKLNLFPNPNNGTFTLQLEKELEITSLFITDINGRLIKEITPRNTLNYEINFEGASGIYFLNLVSENERRTFKLVKE